MSALVIARKEFVDAIRSRTLQGLVVLFATFICGGIVVATNVPTLIDADVDPATFGILFGLLSPAALVVPVISVLVGYRAIAGEVADGGIYCLLGLPHTRRDVLVGKFLGRFGVVTAAILVGFAVGAATLYLTVTSFAVGPYLTFVAATLLLGGVYLAFTTSISAATASPSRAAWGGFGVFVVFQFLWELAGFLARYAVTGTASPEPPLPAWYTTFVRLSPQNAYQAAATVGLPSDDPFVAGIVAGEEASLLTSRPFAFVILIGWLSIPLAVSYWQVTTMEF